MWASSNPVCLCVCLEICPKSEDDQTTNMGFRVPEHNVMLIAPFRRFSFKLCPVVVPQKKHVRSRNFRFLFKKYFFGIAIIFAYHNNFLPDFFWWSYTIRKAQKRDKKLWFRFWVVQIFFGTISHTIENPKIHFSEPRFRSFPRIPSSALVGREVVCELLWAF